MQPKRTLEQWNIEPSRFEATRTNQNRLTPSTWLHAKNFIILCLAVCLSSSIPFFDFSSFHRLFESSCVITPSLTLLLTYETLVEQNQFVLKIFSHWFCSVFFFSHSFIHSFLLWLFCVHARHRCAFNEINFMAFFCVSSFSFVLPKLEYYINLQ